MSENTAGALPSDETIPYAWVDRYLKPVAGLAAWVRSRSAERVELVFWLLTLLGMLPALRADLLFPFDWIQHAESGYSAFWVENPFWFLGLLPAFALFVIAVAQRSRIRLLAIVPYLSILLADIGVRLSVDGLSSVYVISAFTVFLFFVITGRVRSFYFFLFLAFLAAWQYFDNLLAWNQIIEFAATSLVASLIYETIRQNWPLLKQLGRHDSLAMLGQTFKLWSPTLLLIAFGLWTSNQLTSGTEQGLYDQGVVTPYCLFREANPAAHIECPVGGVMLAADDVYPLSSDRIPAAGEPDDPCRVRVVRTEDQPYVPPPFPFGCPDKEGADSWTLSQATFFVSLDKTVARAFEIQAWKRNNILRGMNEAMLSNSAEVGGHARELFSAVPKTTGLVKDPNCRFLDLKCGIVNMVKGGLNDAYDKVWRRAETRFVDTMQAKADGTTAYTVNAVEDARTDLDAVFDEFELYTRKSIERVYKASNLLRMVLTFWLIVIAIKSFLYVFSRVIFDKSTEIHVDLLEQETDAREGTVKHVQEITIPGDYPYDLYYKSNYQPLGPAPQFSIPQWRSSLLSRLRFGAWNMSRVAMPLDSARGVTFNSIEAEYMVDWSLEDGEEVIFSYRNFVAMNENIELRTVISLRVATLLMGRIIFHTARCKGGNGRLILRTRGKPATAKQVRQSIPASRLVAWNRYARFSVDSHLTRRDIFLNGFNLRRSDSEDGEQPQGILIVEADARSGSVMVGTLRFAKHFLLPI